MQRSQELRLWSPRCPLAPRGHMQNFSQIGPHKKYMLSSVTTGENENIPFWFGINVGINLSKMEILDYSTFLNPVH